MPSFACDCPCHRSASEAARIAILSGGAEACRVAMAHAFALATAFIRPPRGDAHDRALAARAIELREGARRFLRGGPAAVVLAVRAGIDPDAVRGRAHALAARDWPPLSRARDLVVEFRRESPSPHSASLSVMGSGIGVTPRIMPGIGPASSPPEPRSKLRAGRAALALV
jgi:hypothetical protein